MRDRIFIHAGFPKAASTTLQRHLFNRHSEIKYLGLYPLHNIGIDTEEDGVSAVYLQDKELRSLYNNIVDLGVIEYEASVNKRLFDSVAEKHIDSAGKCIVLSNEKLTSVFFAHCDNGVKAERLADLFPGAKVILLIRNQYDWLKSQYRDHPFDPRSFAIGKPVSLDDWFKIAFWNKQLRLFQMLNYIDIIDYYAKLFGEANVGVFLFEELAQDATEFSRKISSFMGIGRQETADLLSGKHENRGVSRRYNVYRASKRKYLGWFFKNRILSARLEGVLDGWLKSGKPADYVLSPENLSRVEKYFSPGNRKLVEKYELDLEKYGYFVQRAFR
jgi:hypothetical protein